VKYDTNLKPDLIASTDDTRYQLEDPYLDVEAKRLVATDGSSLVAFPVEVDEGEESRWISGDLLRAVRRLAPNHKVPIHGNAAEDGPSFPCVQQRGPAGFPDWKRVVPSRQEGDPGTVTIALDAVRLLRLAVALGAQPKRDGRAMLAVTVQLERSPADHGPDSLIVRRLGAAAGGPFALLMPCSSAAVPGISVPKAPEPQASAATEPTPR
jgi:hypothetical protein